MEFLTTNAPDPPHWTINSCFGVFHTILVHLGPFGYFTNLEAKQSRVGIFHNERTRSTSLDPKLMFCCVSYYLGDLGQFGCLTKLGGKWAELVQKFVPRSRVGIFCNECTRWYETHRNMSLGSNGVDRVHSFRKILARLRGTNFCTSSARFAPSFVRQPNSPKCTQMVRNAAKR